MDTVALTATRRDLATKPRDIRADRKIPAIFYGAGVTNLPLTLDYQEFRKAFKVAGESTVIDLTVEGTAHKVLVHHVDFDPITDAFAHIDFVNVDMKKPVTTFVPVHLIGESPAVKNHGGVLVHIKSEVEIRCLPADLPHAFELDISRLENIHDAFHVSDIIADRTKIEIFTADDVVICNIAAPKTHEQLEAELATPVGDAVSADVKAAAETEKAAAQASKASDTEKKGAK